MNEVSASAQRVPRPSAIRAGSASVEVLTTDGRTLHGHVDEPKGDPGNSLSRAEIEAKAQQLAAYGHAASEAEMRDLIARVWRLADWPRVERLLP